MNTDLLKYLKQEKWNDTESCGF